MEIGGREGALALTEALTPGDVPSSDGESAALRSSPAPLQNPVGQWKQAAHTDIAGRSSASSSTSAARANESSSNNRNNSRGVANVLNDPFSHGNETPFAGLGMRRVERNPPPARRIMAQMPPRRTSADARSALQRSLRAETVYAICVAHRINLEKLLERVPDGRKGDIEEQRVTRSPDKASAKRAAGTRSTSSSSSDPKKLDVKQIRQYGIGENLVVQLRLYGEKDLFVFRFGCLVCWGYNVHQHQAVKDWMKEFMDRELDSQDTEEERMEFVIEPKEDCDDENKNGREGDAEESIGISAIRQDQIILTTSKEEERLAHSYALAQSVRLGVFEIQVDRSIANTRSIPETMADSGEVHLEHRDVSRQMGGLLMLRCDVNLHTDILDTPDIFWDEERFEPHYIACRTYMDVDKRVDILNQRLGVLKDLYDLLQNGLNVKHGNKLEVIIIVLILVEVLLELLELLHDSWSQK